MRQSLSSEKKWAERYPEIDTFFKEWELRGVKVLRAWRERTIGYLETHDRDGEWVGIGKREEGYFVFNYEWNRHYKTLDEALDAMSIEIRTWDL
jgi:hypothetical protein